MDFSQIPSQKPPPGIYSNFVDPPTQAHTDTVVVTVTLTLMIIMVSFRLYVDIAINRKLEKVGCT